MLALCPNNNEVWIYSGCHAPDSKTWVKQYVLKEHDMIVSGIDWCPVTNRIVTASHDRCAWVFVFDGETWQPQTVILRLSRGATRVKWSPDGQKFAVGSSCRFVPVCHYDEELNWWVGKMLRKHKSTIVSVAWHPNSQLLATACTDHKCRVFTAHIPEVDGMEPDPGCFAEAGVFGEVLAEFDSSKGWVEDVAWSPNGSKLAFCGHDSTLTVVHFDLERLGAPPVLQVVHLSGLPLRSLLFASESALMGAGYDMNPAVYLRDAEDNWTFKESLDKAKAKKEETKGSSFGAARAMFAARTSHATKAPVAKQWTQHEATITLLSQYSPPGRPVSHVATSGDDGKLVLWPLASLGLEPDTLAAFA
jgi:actin related protein 2/3 complex subunit 1A/1B